MIKQVKELPAKYPDLYRLTDDNRRYGFGYSQSNGGFECGDGWYDLLDELSNTLVQLLQPYQVSEWPLIYQVKEKFSTLRFYTGKFPESIREHAGKAIHHAEKRSSETCEQCGEPGKRWGGGWWLTLCVKHADERRATGREVIAVADDSD